MLVKNNKIHILSIVFNMASYNLCMYVYNDSFVILFVIITILAGKYGLHSYQHTSIYKIEKCHLLGTVIICMSTEPSGHQHSETAVTILKFGWFCGLSNKVKSENILILVALVMITFSHFTS